MTVLVESAERSDMIDLERAKRAKERAEETLTRLPREDAEFQKARLALMRALTRLNIATKPSYFHDYQDFLRYRNEGSGFFVLNGDIHNPEFPDAARGLHADLIADTHADQRLSDR